MRELTVSELPMGWVVLASDFGVRPAREQVGYTMDIETIIYG